MDKWLGWGIVVVVIIAGSILAFQVIYQPKQIENLESLVPADALYYLYSYNPNKKLADFSNSQFCKKISSLPIYEKHLKPKIEELKDKTLFLQDIFSADSAVALFPSESVTTGKDAFDPAKLDVGKFLLLTKLESKNTNKILEDLNETLSKDKTSEIRKYKGIKITTYTPAKKEKQKTSVDFVLLGNVLASSNDKGITEEVIGLFKEESQESLLTDETFKKVTENYDKNKKDVLLWVYANYQEYYDRLFSSLAKENLKQGDFSIEKGIQFGRFRDFMKNFSDISIGMCGYLDYSFLKEGLVFKGYQKFDKTKDKANILDMLLSYEGDASITKIIPSDIIACFGLSGNATKYWNYLKSILAMAQEIGYPQEAPQAAYSMPPLNPLAALSLAESFLGIDFEKDILPLLGSNFAGVLSDLEEVVVEMEQAGPGPGKMPFVLPGFSLILQAKDKDKAQALKNIITETLIPKLNEHVKSQIIDARKKAIEKEKKMSEMQEETAGESLSQEKMVMEPAPVKDMLTVGSQDYRGYEVSVLLIEDLPFKNIVIDPSCFVMDDKLIVSSSFKSAKQIISLEKGFRDSLDSYLTQELEDEAILTNHSFLYYFDLGELINKVTQTNMFKSAKPFVMMASKGKVTGEDIDSIIDVLNDISLFVQTYRMSEDSVGESLVYIKIEGLN